MPKPNGLALIGGEVGRGTCPGRHAGQCHGFLAATAAAPSDIPAVVDLSVCTPSSAGVAEKGFGRNVHQHVKSGGFQGLLEYPPHGGLPAHRAAGAEWLRRHQLSIGPENVLVTSGAQNGMAIPSRPSRGRAIWS